MVTETVQRLESSEAGGRGKAPSGDSGNPAANPGNGPVRTSQRIAVSTLALAIAAILFLFYGTAETAVIKWTNTQSHNHIFFIIPISAYLVWERWQLLASLSPRPSPWGLAVVGSGALGWLLGDVAGVLFVQQFALVLMIQGAFLTILGWNVVRRMAFPLLYLVFLVPFGDFLVPKLQYVTAQFVVNGLQLIGIPVFLDGVFISIPSGNFQVAEACSGLRFLTASVALGVLFANIMYRSWWRRGAFLVLTLVVPVAANGLRALGIVLLAHYSNNELAIGVDHLVYGWIFFTFVTAVLFGIGMTFRDGGVLHRPSPEGDSTVPGATAVILGFSAATIVVASAAPAYAGYIRQSLMETRIAQEMTLPAGFAAWSPADAGAPQWEPNFIGADRDYHWQFRVPDSSRMVDLHIAFYKYQRDGAEVVNRTNRLDGGSWHWAANGSMTAQVERQVRQVPTARLTTRGQNGRVVAYWYWVGGRIVTNPLLAKALQVKANLIRSQVSAAAITVSAPYDETPREAVEAIAAFLESAGRLGPALAAVTSD